MATENQKKQIENVGCGICFDNILPDEPIGKCQRCSKKCHRSCLFMWLTTRKNPSQEPNCPYCRADMRATLELLEALARAANPGIQQACQNNNINGYIFEDVSNSRSEDETETESDSCSHSDSD